MLKIQQGKCVEYVDGIELEITYNIVAEKYPGEEKISYGIQICTNSVMLTEETLIRDISKDFTQCRTLINYLKQNKVKAIGAQEIICEILAAMEEDFDLEA